VDGDSPGGWHTGEGVGAWIGILNAGTALTLETDRDFSELMARIGLSFSRTTRQEEHRYDTAHALLRDIRHHRRLAIAAIYSIGAPPPSSMDNRTNTLTEAETATVKEFQANVQAYAASTNSSTARSASSTTRQRPKRSMRTAPRCATRSRPRAQE
jgi:hypothetical protein